MNWLNEIAAANQRFQKQTNIDLLPVERKPCPYAVITCMDPRINLEAIGIPAFTSQGESDSQVRVMRTIGAIHENRSIVIGTHLAGFKEIVVLMHTDCGCCLAHSHIDRIVSNMRDSLSDQKFKEVSRIIGDPVNAYLSKWLHTFEDPKMAVRKEVKALRDSPFVPESTVIHGLIFDVQSGAIEVVVAGYDTSEEC